MSRVGLATRPRPIGNRGKSDRINRPAGTLAVRVLGNRMDCLALDYAPAFTFGLKFL